MTEAAYREVCDIYLAALRESYKEYFANTRVAAIVFPTTMVPAPRIGDDIALMVRGKTVSFETAIARNIAPGSTAGVPELVLSAGLTSDGLPVAIEIDGLAESDCAVLALGVAIERLIGRFPPPPRR